MHFIYIQSMMLDLYIMRLGSLPDFLLLPLLLLSFPPPLQQVSV